MAFLTNSWRTSRSSILYSIILQSLLCVVLSADAANATMVTVGYLWEHPLRMENNNASEAVMDQRLSKSTLRLICDISPPLPSDDDHWEKRNELVKWVKVSPKYETVESIRYWSNDMTKTAISFSNVTLDVLGTYACIYGGVSSFISVLVADVKVAETLERPRNLLELKTYVTFMKDKSGLDGWSKDETQISKKIGTKELCPTFGNSKETSQSVHELRVSDIKVITAMGDTFTVGLGARATSLNDFFTEFKDVSWSIGGGDHLNQSTTLPNIIKQFSPTLKGASVTNRENMESDLNVAFTGASVRDLEDQAKSLVSRMKNMKDIDYQNDWKMATIWIGTDDLCYVCRDKDTNNPGTFIKYVMRTLSYLQREVPKLFVNLVPPMDVTSLHQLHEGDNSSCQILGWNSCECLFTNAASDRQKISDTAKAYKRLLEELVNSGLYETQGNFAVVIQPALYNPPVVTKDGRLVKEYFGLDCFHFTVRGQAAAALALWKNMLEPCGKKTEQWGDEEILKCPPKKNPYVFTKKNSHTSPRQAKTDDDHESTVDFPPTAAVALAVCFTAVVVIVVVTVWRSRGSRRRPESLKLLYAPGPRRPRI